MNSLRLLGKASSINVRKVLWTCAELALPFAQEEWGSGFQDTGTPAFRALNPNAMVPVLIDGDFIVWESNAICRYLAAQYGDGELLPAAPRRRAVVEQWMDWQATELNNAWRYAFMALMRASPAHADPELIAASVDNWNRHVAILAAQLEKTGAYAAGASFTLADVVLGLSLNRWLMTPMQRPHLPAIDAYLERLMRRPGFMEYGRNGTP